MSMMMVVPKKRWHNMRRVCGDRAFCIVGKQGLDPILIAGLRAVGPRGQMRTLLRGIPQQVINRHGLKIVKVRAAMRKAAKTGNPRRTDPLHLNPPPKKAEE